MTLRTASRFAGPTTPAHLRRGRGFTLVELMISLVLVLLLVLAITQIFDVTTKAIGKGNATGEVVRGLDAARTALQMDFAGTDNIAYSNFGDESGILPLSRQPAIIINSTAAPAFTGRRDMEADQDADPVTIDVNNDGDELDATDRLMPYQIGTRWFRTDSLSFFTSGEFESQTNLAPLDPVTLAPPATEPSFHGNTTSSEAWVWYGHANVYDGAGPLDTTGSYLWPAEANATTNPHNFLASQFVLLRSAMLLKAQQAAPPSAATTEETVLNDAGQPILHVRPSWTNPADFSGGLNVGPLGYRSRVARLAAGGNQLEPYEIQNSRVDVAGVTATLFRERLQGAQRFGTLGAEANRPLRFNAAAPRDANPDTWYNRLFARTNGNVQNQNAGRFWINPLVLKPLNAGEVSQASNYLLGGAAQFVVEYAGDFLAQTPTGDVDTAAPHAGLAPDGVIDFTIDRGGVRHIRWYGMPRDVDGAQLDDNGNPFLLPGPASATAVVTVTMPTGPVPSSVLLTSTDVRPLADYLPRSGPAPSALTATNGYPFEKRLPARYQSGTPEVIQSRDGIGDYFDPALFTGQDPFDWSYMAAWGPGDFDGSDGPSGPLYTSTNPVHPFDFTTPANPTGALRPSLLRVITVGIDRQSKLENPISMELVFRVPQE